MTYTPLPQNLLVRSAHRDDAQAIVDINSNSAHELTETGTTESTVNDVFELWDNERMALDTNTRVLTTQNGELVAYTGIAATNRGIMLDVHTTVHPSYQDQTSILAYLYQFVDERARSLCAENPALPHQLYTWSFTSTTKQALEQEGYTVDSSEYRMEITFTDDIPPSAPQPLQGITIRPFVAGKEERDVYNVIASAFPDIDGKPYRPFEEWYTNVFEKSTSFDPSMLYVALVDNQIVGIILSRNYPEDAEGYIWQVAVLRMHRGRGIARQLLLTAFNEYYRRGVRHVELGVDSESQTGSHQLYAKVGMHKRTQVDKMIKVL